MKKLISILLLVSFLSFGFTANAQRRCYLTPRTHHVVCLKHRNWWSRHRDKATVGLGTIGGAGVGAIAGGRRGAFTGMLAGGLSSALYTYKLRHRHRYYRRY